MLRSQLIGAAIAIGTIVAGTAEASVISVSLEDFQSSGVIVYTFNGSEPLSGSSGIFRLRTSDPVGSPADQITDPAYGFCIELFQAYSSTTELYDAGDLTTANNPINIISGQITAPQRDLAEQLWAKYFDPTWLDPPPYSNTQITDAIAFHAMLYEIFSDFDGVSLSSMDLSSGLFTLEGGYLLDINDPSQELPVLSVAQSYLDGLSLTYTGPLANLVALTNPSFQDYVVEVVPEVSSMMLALCGMSVAGVGVGMRRFRRSAR